MQKIKKYKHRLTTRYRMYKHNAKKRDLKFELTKKEFKNITEQRCHYCNEFSNDTHQYTGIDRVDSKKGYAFNNIVPCCSMCNRMKNKYTYKNFINKCNLITNHIKGEEK